MYEIGLSIALLLWVYGAIMDVVNRNSRLSRNLRRVGMRPTDFGVEQLTAKVANRPVAVSVLRYTFFQLLYLMWALTSWVAVVLFVAMNVHAISKRSGMPQPLKELLWRLRNTDMSRDEIIKALMTSQGVPETEFARFRDALVAETREQGVLI